MLTLENLANSLFCGMEALIKSYYKLGELLFLRKSYLCHILKNIVHTDLSSTPLI